jgi:hypothetical protein
MAKKRKNLNATTKVNPPTNLAPPPVNRDGPPFYQQFPLELHYEDNGEKKICWFKDDIDMAKHIKRYGLKDNHYTIKNTTRK